MEGDNDDRRLPLAILGGTGYVGRLLARRLVTHPRFRLGMIVGSQQSVGKTYRDVWEQKEAALTDNYGPMWQRMPFPPELEDVAVHGVDDVDPAHVGAVISCLAPGVGHLEDVVEAKGLSVVSISPYERAGHVAVVEMCAARGESPEAFLARRRLKSPNCVVCGTSLVVDAIDRVFGVRELCVTTMQSISGRGDAMYRGDRITHNVMPIANTTEGTETCICSELRELFPSAKVTVRAYRVGVHFGHTVDVRLRLKKNATDPEDVERALLSYRPLAHVALDSTPDAPVQIVREMGAPQPRTGATINTPCTIRDGMQVRVGNVAVVGDTVALTLVVNNLVRGAYGAAIQLLEYHRWCSRQVVGASG